MEMGCHLAREEEFSPDDLEKADEIIKEYRGKPGALIPVLEKVQGVVGYLPESIQRRVARGLDIPLAQVYGVVTFYSFFTMTPRGKHQIRVCLGTACHVKGAQKVVDQLERELKCKVGECTEDGKFGLEAVRCLGCCALAPVMIVDEDVHKELKASRLSKIIKAYE